MLCPLLALLEAKLRNIHQLVAVLPDGIQMGLFSQLMLMFNKAQGKEKYALFFFLAFLKLIYATDWQEHWQATSWLICSKKQRTGGISTEVVYVKKD